MNNANKKIEKALAQRFAYISDAEMYAALWSKWTGVDFGWVSEGSLYRLRIKAAA